MFSQVQVSSYKLLDPASLGTLFDVLSGSPNSLLPQP